MSPATERSQEADSPLRSTTVIACLVLLVLTLALDTIPGMKRWSLLDRDANEAELAQREVGQLEKDEQKVGLAELDFETRTRAELAQPEVVEAPQVSRGPIAQEAERFELPAIDAESPPVSIEDGSGSMARFYASLAQTASKKGATRIVYFGDSVVVSDYVTGTLRRKLQDQFGDAGHGFVLMADAWPSYFHNDLYRFASKGWKLSRIVGPYSKDGLYGLGGVSFQAPPGVRARFGTAKKGTYGRKVSRFRLLYLKQPYGGRLKLLLDGEPYTTIETEAETKTSGFFDVTAPDGAHMLEVVTAGRFTRTFGVVMERDEPGVVLDAIGIQGARLRFLDKQDDGHWAEQLQDRSPNLIVYEFGANESGDGFAYSMEDYHRTMRDVLLQTKRAVPNAGCLVLSAMDRAAKKGKWATTLAIIPHIVREQEATAKEVGCAFWSTYKAMGGRGSMAKWVRRGLGQADMTHPTGYGAQVLGNWLFQALMEGYNAHITSGIPDGGTPATAP